LRADTRENPVGKNGVMTPGIERKFNGPDVTNSASSFVVNNPIQSQMVVRTPKNNNTSTQKPTLKFLIYGRTGYLGGLLGKLCEKQGIQFVYGRGRLEERSQLLQEIQAVKPTHVFNAAGLTGRPNADWCESHKVETIRTNVVGTLTLADVCREHGLLMINYGSGCIFEFDAAHPMGSGIGFKEEEKPNYTGSFYSKSKAVVISFSVHSFFFPFPF
jgi:UDP-glucose 4,6-dehydratase